MERSLWAQGCGCWQDFLDDPCKYSCGTASQDLMVAELERSVEALAGKHHQYFRKALGTAQSWRAWPEFRDGCVYLDIETNGTQSDSCITMIGLYDGKEFTCLRAGEDLGNFPDVISHYGMIVTFFGTGFDLPVLQRTFPKVKFDQIHLDLCPALRTLGHRGGLKKIEVQLGISRGEDTQGLNGWDAVKLWNRYQRGDEAALQTLIEYNREDVVNLERITEIAYRRLVLNLAFGGESR